MAARDQKIQSIYVVTVSILCALLLIGWLYTAFTASTTSKSLEAAQQKERTTQTENVKLNNQKQAIGQMLGAEALSEAEYKQLVEQISGDEKFQKLVDQFAKDMALFGPSTPQEQRNYASLVAYLMQELRARNQQVDNTNRELAQAKDENLAVVKREREASANEKKRADDLEKQLGTERADFTTKLDASEKSVEEVSKSLTLAKEERLKEKNKLSSDISSRDAELVKVRQVMNDLRTKLDQFQGDDFQTPQGQITTVSADGTGVWINLGKRDGLRVGTRFSVIDPDQGRVSNDVEAKAHLEVVEVKDELSRARILESSNSDPIVRGDEVYSIAWQPGRKVEFALLGKMDLNNDGVDDRSTVKQLIQESGGVVVEEMLPDGKQTGKMTYDTRWLVIGEAYDPTAERGMTTSGDYGAKYSDTLKRAKELGVPTINLDKLMSYLRASSDDRSIPMGAATRPADLAPVGKLMPASKGTVSEFYKNLRPSGPLSNE